MTPGDPLRYPGARVTLRDWCLDDLPPYRQWSEPGHVWQEFDGPYYPRPSSEQREKTLAMIESRIRNAEWPTPRSVLVIADAATDDMIGTVSRYWQSEESNWLSLGLVIFDPDRWNGGLGTEALGLWSESIFEAMPELHRLDLRTWSGNVGMMRLAEKLGYRLEARFRDARSVRGELYDGIGYGVLRSEWRERYPEGFGASLRTPSPAPRPRDPNQVRDKP